MQEAEFDKAIRGLHFLKGEYYASVGSTNDVVAGWVQQGNSGPAIAYADEQTSGRGRDGRRWFTPPESALAFSLLLNPPVAIRPNLLGLFSGLGALAVCLGLEELLSLSPLIKWPNDVLLDGKKVCGVLAEMQWKGQVPSAVILGIGINISEGSVPPTDLVNFPAICVEEIFGSKIKAGELLGTVLKHLMAWKDQLGDPSFVRAWEQRLAYRGRHVHLSEASGDIDGEMLGLNPEGNLQLRLATGEVKAFSIGEIQLRPPAK